MMKNHFKLFLLSGFCFTALISCNRGDKSIRVYSVKKEKTQPIDLSVPETAAPSAQSGFAWTAPESWVEEPAGGMHLAAFSIPFEGGKDQVTLMSLQGDGGGMLLNVNRWLDQLNMAPVSISRMEKMGSLEEGALGTYTVFDLINEKQPEKAFIVAVFSLSDQTLFVKLITASERLQVEKPSFTAFCKSIHTHE